MYVRVYRAKGLIGVGRGRMCPEEGLSLGKMAAVHHPAIVFWLLFHKRKKMAENLNQCLRKVLEIRLYVVLVS